MALCLGHLVMRVLITMSGLRIEPARDRRIKPPVGSKAAAIIGNWTRRYGGG
jgi:hypothetical protein